MTLRTSSGPSSGWALRVVAALGLYVCTATAHAQGVGVFYDDLGNGADEGGNPQRFEPADGSPPFTSIPSQTAGDVRAMLEAAFDVQSEPGLESALTQLEQLLSTDVAVVVEIPSNTTVIEQMVPSALADGEFFIDARHRYSLSGAAPGSPPALVITDFEFDWYEVGPPDVGYHYLPGTVTLRRAGWVLQKVIVPQGAAGVRLTHAAPNSPLVGFEVAQTSWMLTPFDQETVVQTLGVPDDGGPVGGLPFETVTLRFSIEEELMLPGVPLVPRGGVLALGLLIACAGALGSRSSVVRMRSRRRLANPRQCLDASSSKTPGCASSTPGRATGGRE